MTLAGKKIILGITGSIAAYKAADWVRALDREGARVTVLMTGSACRFISPLTMAALSGNPVHSSMFSDKDPETIPHISLGKEHDLLLIAPASAQTIARLAHGLADDLLATVTLAFTGPVILCPAMNSGMFLHPATQANLKTIKGYGYKVLEPGHGKMACGDEGPGRLIEWEKAKQSILAALSPQDLSGERVLVSAGPTREYFDPVRFLTNPSTGKMGYAIAAAARQRGAEVTLVSGQTVLPCPAGVRRIEAENAVEMREQIIANLDGSTMVIKAAAVSDYRPAEYCAHKVKKGQNAMHLMLSANPDILRELGEMKKQAACFPLLAGFAAESRDHLSEGLRKLREKNLDLIVINDIGDPKTGFAAETNRVSILDRNGSREDLPLMSKEETAHRILDALIHLKRNQR